MSYLYTPLCCKGSTVEAFAKRDRNLSAPGAPGPHVVPAFRTLPSAARVSFFSNRPGFCCEYPNVPLWFATGIWVLYCIIRGWLALSSQKEVPR